MAISYISGQSGNHYNGGTSSSTVAVNLSPSNGSLLCVSVGFDSAGGISATIADNAAAASNTYIAVDALYDSVGYGWATFYANNITGSPTTITATLNSGTAHGFIIVDTFTGITTTGGPAPLNIARNTGGNNSFSNNNRTVKNTGSGNQSCFGAIGHNSGKYIYSLLLDHEATGASPGSWGLGLGSASATSAGGTNLGFTNDGEFAVYMDASTAICNGTMFTSPAVTGSIGDQLDMAVDLTNGLFWYRTTTTPNWNANPTANPTTGVNGVSFASIGLSLGTYYPGLSVNTGTGGDGEQYTLVNSPAVAGFSQWGWSPLDGHTGQVTGSIPAATKPSSGSISPSVNGDLIYGSMVGSTAAGDAFTDTGVGFVPCQEIETAFFTEYRIQSVAAPIAATWTHLSTDSFIPTVMSFMAAPTAVPTFAQGIFVLP